MPPIQWQLFWSRVIRFRDNFLLRMTKAEWYDSTCDVGDLHNFLDTILGQLMLISLQIIEEAGLAGPLQYFLITLECTAYADNFDDVRLTLTQFYVKMTWHNFLDLVQLTLTHFGLQCFAQFCGNDLQDFHVNELTVPRHNLLAAWHTFDLSYNDLLILDDKMTCIKRLFYVVPMTWYFRRYRRQFLDTLTFGPDFGLLDAVSTDLQWGSENWFRQFVQISNGLTPYDTVWFGYGFAYWFQRNSRLRPLRTGWQSLPHRDMFL